MNDSFIGLTTEAVACVTLAACVPECYDRVCLQLRM